MGRYYLALVAGLALAIAVVFARNFVKRRQAASLVVTQLALMAAAWPCREMRWLPLSWAEPLLAAAGPLLALGLLVVLNAERQR